MDGLAHDDAAYEYGAEKYDDEVYKYEEYEYEDYKDDGHRGQSGGCKRSGMTVDIGVDLLPGLLVLVGVVVEVGASPWTGSGSSLLRSLPTCWVA